MAYCAVVFVTMDICHLMDIFYNWLPESGWIAILFIVILIIITMTITVIFLFIFLLGATPFSNCKA